VVPFVFGSDQFGFDVDFPGPLVEEGSAETVDGFYGLLRVLLRTRQLNRQHKVKLILVVGGVPVVQGHSREIAHSRRRILTEDIVPVLGVVLVERCGVKLEQSPLASAQDVVDEVEPNLSHNHKMAMEMREVKR
jgi:hypothetical protein